MEQDKTTVDVPCNDRWVIENLIDRFEKIYKVSIVIDNEEDRYGVVFFSISSTQFTPNIIFEIGYYYSGYVRQLRDKGEIE